PKARSFWLSLLLILVGTPKLLPRPAQNSLFSFVPKRIFSLAMFYERCRGELEASHVPHAGPTEKFFTSATFRRRKFGASSELRLICFSPRTQRIFAGPPNSGWLYLCLD